MKRFAVPFVVLLGLFACGEEAPGPSTTTATTPVAALPTTPAVSTPSPTVSPMPVLAEVRVKQVVGRSTAAARSILRGSGLQVLVVKKYSPLVPGTVINQFPANGVALEGDTIRLVVAKAFPLVPGVLGKVLDGARSTLRGAGYRVVVVHEASSLPAGTVIRMTPAAGAELLPGRTVTITVAKPPPAPPAIPPTCTPGYSPCLPPASDYDCAGGSGNGPEYVYGTVRVTGSDPYGLDSDGDGYGCE
jgi:hypothetical protein